MFKPERLVVFIAMLVLCALAFGLGYIIKPTQEVTTIISDSVTSFTTVPPVTVIQNDAIMEFGSIADLQGWWMARVANDLGGAIQPSWDCMDCTKWVVDRAQLDGYWMAYFSCDAAWYNTVFHLRQLPAGSRHAICLTWIQGARIWIEPTTAEMIREGGWID